MNKCLRLASILSLSCLVSTSALASGWGKYFVSDMSKSKTCTYKNVKAKVSVGKSVCTFESHEGELGPGVTICHAYKSPNYIKNTSKDNATADVRAVWENTDTRNNTVMGFKAKTYYDLKAGKKKQYASTEFGSTYGFGNALERFGHACRVGKDN